MVSTLSRDITLVDLSRWHVLTSVFSHLFSRRIIDQLPRPNYHLLCHFLCVLHHISRRSTHNLMSAANLGVCVGPSLLWSDSPATCPTEDLRTVPALVEILITHCELLCGPHVPNMLGDPRDSGTEESDCEYIMIYLYMYLISLVFRKNRSTEQKILGEDEI